MTKPHRMSAGGIILQDGAVLLVRYRHNDGGTFLVGPGGRVEGTENAYEAIVREAREETGITVVPRKILAVESLDCSQFLMSKVWALCDVGGGEVSRTEGARTEGIIDAGWFTRERLDDEVVYPSLLREHDWQSFFADNWQVPCLPTRTASF